MKIIFLSGFMCLLCACNLDKLLFESSESIETVELQQVYERSGRILGEYMIIGDRALKEASIFTGETAEGGILPLCGQSNGIRCYRMFKGGFGIYHASGEYFTIRGYK